MAKVALLIGVSDYKPGLQPLPAALRDIEAMRRALQDAETGGFQVTVLANPEPTEIQQSIDALFSERTAEDLVLLFFSGHGIKDDYGKLFFGTSITRKKQNGELMKWTAVPASYIHETMKSCRCKRQVVILDCCFSGAFAEGMLPKSGHDTVDLQMELGGEGRAILTSSTSTQLSFEQQDESLSIYTRYVVEGIETGAADMDRDGFISIEDVHKYARQKVFETAPAMKPEIYASKEGWNIHLAQTRTNDPALEFRRAAEDYTKQGEIDPILRAALEALREKLNLSSEQAQSIEAEVSRPFQLRKEKLDKYQHTLTQAMQREPTLSETTCKNLKLLQRNLGLRDEDIAEIQIPVILPQRSPKRTFGGIEWTPPKLRIIWVTGIVSVIVPMLFFGLVSSRPLGMGLHHRVRPNQPIVTASPPIVTATQPPPSTIGQPGGTATTSYQFFTEGIRRDNLEDFQGAMTQYDQAIQLNKDWGPNDPSIGYYGLASALDNRGNNLTRLGDPQKALKYLNQAISLQPTYAHAYEDRGDAHANLGDNQTAFDDYTKAAKLYKENGNHTAAKVVSDKATTVTTKRVTS